MAHIYIVDDEPDVCESLQLLLESHGHRVVTTGKGEDVESYVASLEPDLVILDVLLEGMDGMAVLQQLVENPDTAPTPVILVSAIGQKRKIIEGLEKGAVDYIPKPFHNEVLLARVDAALLHRPLEDTRKRNETLAALPQTASTVAREMCSPLYQILNCLNLIEEQHGEEMGSAVGRLHSARKCANSIMESLTTLSGGDQEEGGSGM